MYMKYRTPVRDIVKTQAKNNWRDKKIGWCGTSIPAGSGATGLQGYVSILEKAFGSKIDNQSVNSSGMVWAGNRERTLGATIVELKTANFDTLQSYESKLIGKKYDLLVIDHGFNDRDYVIGDSSDATSTTYCGSINRMITALLRDNPKLLIVLTTPPSLYTPHKIGSGKGKLNAHTVAIRKATFMLAKKWRVPICDLSYVTGITEDTVEREIPDGIHPGDSTHTRIARVMLQFINDL